MRFNQEIKVGLLATTALIIVYLGSSFLKGTPVFSSQNCYYTVYADGSGLSTSSLVLFNGVPVGKIRELTIQPDQDHSILVTFETQKHIRLTDATRTRIISPSLLGGKAIDILFEEGNLLQNYDTVPSEGTQSIGEVLMGDTLSSLQDTQQIASLVGKLVTNLVTCTDRIDNLLTAVGGTAESLGETADGDKSGLHVVRQHIVEVFGMLADRQNGVKPLLEKLNRLVAETKGTQVQELIAKLDNVLNGIGGVLNKLEGGDNTLSRVFDDDGLYNNVNQTISSLNQLLNDFRVNPGRYVRFSLLGNQQKNARK